MSKVVIIIPTFNERDTIKLTIDKLLRVFKKAPQKYDFKILVIDDSSPDGTAQVVKKIQKKSPRVQLLLNKQKNGLGSAYIKGFEHAIKKLNADIVFEFDADGSHQPKYIIPMLEKLEKGADVVVGSRYVKGGSMPANWGINRKLISYIGNLVARGILWTWQYRDMTSGFRATKTKYLKKIDLNKLLSKQFAYKLHLYFALHELGAKIVEEPIEFIDRSEGKSKFPKNNMIESLKVVLTLRARKSQKLLKVITVGFIGAAIQFSLFNILRTQIAPEFANALAVETAIVSNFLINNFWTFKDEKVMLSQLGKLIVKFFKFNLVSLGSLLIQFLTMKIGVALLGRSVLIENGLVFLGIVIGLAWNYTMYTKLIWKSSAKK